MIRSRQPRTSSGHPLAAIVIFGSSGDLATTKVFPAIESEAKAGRLRAPFRAFGVDKTSPRHQNPPWMTFLRADLARRETYVRLAGAMEEVSQEGPALFYLATPPRLFPEVVQGLKESGLARPGSKIAVEKPFGVDLRSSRRLEALLSSSFERKRTFRVDHFLCKAGTLGMGHFRFDHGRLERIWNRRFVDCVQIMADAHSALGGRGDFYDSVGVARDMVQNHLLQLLCLVAMDRPGSGGPCSHARAKAKLLKSVAPVSQEDVVWGQYMGYERVPGVRKGSTTPTFVALKARIMNRRWDGVPFYLRTGRPLARDATEVVVVFKGGKGEGTRGPRRPRWVRFCIDPAPGIEVMGEGSEGVRRDGGSKAEHVGEYQKVIRAVLRGDQGRFADEEFNRLSWKLIDPLIEGQRAPDRYAPGGWGPPSSDLLLAKDGRTWVDGREGRPA